MKRYTYPPPPEPLTPEALAKLIHRTILRRRGGALVIVAALCQAIAANIDAHAVGLEPDEDSWHDVAAYVRRMGGLKPERRDVGE